MDGNASIVSRSAVTSGLYERYVDLCERLALVLGTTAGPPSSLPGLEELDDELRSQLLLIEQFILPVLELSAPASAEKFRAQHRELCSSLSLVASDLAQFMSPKAAADRLLAQLHSHLQHTARVLLPWVDTCLSRRQKTRILEGMAGVHKHELSSPPQGSPVPWPSLAEVARFDLH